MIRLINERVLTKKENLILLLIAEGLTNGQIAERLNISSSTVKTYLEKIYMKFEVHNRIELLVFAVKHNIIVFE